MVGQNFFKNVNWAIIFYGFQFVMRNRGIAVFGNLACYAVTFPTQILDQQLLQLIVIDGRDFNFILL